MTIGLYDMMVEWFQHNVTIVLWRLSVFKISKP